MNSFDFYFIAYRIVYDDYLHDQNCRILDLLVQSESKQFIVRITKHKYEAFFSVQKIKSSLNEVTLWHDQLEDLEGTPVLVQVQSKFYLAIVNEESFPVITSVLCLNGLHRKRQLLISSSPLEQIELKKIISQKLLIGWQLSVGEQILLVEQNLSQQIALTESLVGKETKLQNKRRRQQEIQNRLPIEIVVPGQGKKFGVPVLESEWVSLKHRTPAVLMNGESNSRNTLGLPVAYFVVDKTRPTKPVQDKLVNLLEAARGYATV